MMILITIALWIIACALTGIFLHKAMNDENIIRIKFLDHKEKPTIIEQVKKCEEEDEEFYKAILNNNYKNAIEEFHDSIQAKLGALDILGISVNDIKEGQAIHYIKLIQRGWEFKGGKNEKTI